MYYAYVLFYDGELVMGGSKKYHLWQWLCGKNLDTSKIKTFSCSYNGCKEVTEDTIRDYNKYKKRNDGHN